MTRAYSDLLDRFCRFTECKVENELSLQLVHVSGNQNMILDITTKMFEFNRWPNYMHAIWRLEEGLSAAREHKSKYGILCGFADCDALYVSDDSHEMVRLDGKDAPPRERQAIASSVFIPMKYWEKVTKDMPRFQPIKTEWIEKDF